MAATVQPETVEQQQYAQTLRDWQQKMSDSLTNEDGWLTLTGLDWLREGENTVGSATGSDVTLPDSAPARLGVLTLTDGQVTLDVSTEGTASPLVTIDGQPATHAVLLNDHHVKGPSLVRVGTVSFHIMNRGILRGVRVRDSACPDRLNFPGRHWFSLDQTYRVNGEFTPDETPRQLLVDSSADVAVEVNHIGSVTFTLHDQLLRLEAFSGGGHDQELWFVFKDATSGITTYGGGRFLYAPVDESNRVSLDFNRAYFPPCAFTIYATCPLPPRENTLPIPIEAGERY